MSARTASWRHGSCASGHGASSRNGSPASLTAAGQDASRVFPPELALHLTKLACERPQARSATLSHWDCTELARQLVAEGLVDAISTDTVWRILARNDLKPWRQHSWLSQKVPRDEAYATAVRTISDLYTRPLTPGELVLCVDEKTSIQPRRRTSATLPARPRLPTRVEQNYHRDGALNLFAAFNTRTGEVIGWCAERKRAAEFVSFLELLDAAIPAGITTIHLVLDNLRVHKGKRVRAWLTEHPRFVLHFPPVHCSWMNQVEQWFSILQRKALRIVDFESTLALDRHLHGFIARWNKHAHAFNWTTASVTRVLAKCHAAEAIPDTA